MRGKLPEGAKLTVVVQAPAADLDLDAGDLHAIARGDADLRVGRYVPLRPLALPSQPLMPRSELRRRSRRGGARITGTSNVVEI